MIRRPPRSTLFPYTTPLPIYEVQERERAVALAVAPVALGDVHDEAQVRLDHVLLGVEVPALDALGELDLLAGGEERHLPDRKSTRLNSSHANISYAVFCLKKT